MTTEISVMYGSEKVNQTTTQLWWECTYNNITKNQLSQLVVYIHKLTRQQLNCGGSVPTTI